MVPKLGAEEFYQRGYYGQGVKVGVIDYGVGNLVRLVRMAKFPVLAANVAGVHDVKPYVILPARSGLDRQVSPL